MGDTRLTKLKKATEDNPENLDAWFELGKFATDRFIVGIGEDALTKVAQERPDDAKVLELLAKALNRRRKLVESEKIYLRALEIEPENLALLTGLAVVYGNQGELEKAVSWFEKIFATEKGYPWAVLAYTHTLSSLGRDEIAMPVLEDALKSNPDSALINILFGMEQQKRGNQSQSKTHTERGLTLLDKAECEEQTRALRVLIPDNEVSVIKHGTQLLKKDPDNMELQLIVSSARVMKDPQTASIEVKKLLEKDPNNPRVLGTLIGILVQMRDIAGVMEFKERLEQAAPEDDLNAVVNLVLAREQSGGLIVSEKAREEYVEAARKILRRMPVDPQANFAYLHALIVSNQFDDAKDHANKMANEMEMNDIRQRLFFAFTLRNLGMNEESRVEYEKALNSADTPYENLLVQLVEHLETENYPEIMKICKEFIEQNEATPELYSILGRVQHYTNQDEARINLQMGADLGDPNAIILLSSLLAREGEEQKANNLLQQLVSSKEVKGITRARCLTGLKQFDEASNILKKYLEKQPGSYLAWYLLALIKRRESKDEVKSVLKSMFESGIHDKGSSDPEKLYQKLETDKAVDAFANEIMIGVLGGKVKHMLLKGQVMSLLNAEFEEDAK